MIRYQVRSKELIDIVNELKSERLIKSPYFQRNLVWRDLHKVDFIKTILLGLPFPQIFIAKGEIDVESMTTNSCVVDGQQRLTAIVEYVDGKIAVDGEIFSGLDASRKEQFLKYQIPIIDLDIKQSDPLLKEVFKRLNRTFYALSSIEKQSTEFASSDFMVAAKLMCDQLFFESDASSDVGVRELDPMIPGEVISRARRVNVDSIHKLLLDSGVFSGHEISRMIPLNFSLNVLATCCSGVYNRNSGVAKLLEADSVVFNDFVEMIERINDVASFILKMKLGNKSYWLNKANLFSLLVVLYDNYQLISTKRPSEVSIRLKDFSSNTPEDYAIAAREAVNNKRERGLREWYIKKLLLDLN